MAQFFVTIKIKAGISFSVDADNIGKARETAQELAEGLIQKADGHYIDELKAIEVLDENDKVVWNERYGCF